MKRVSSVRPRLPAGSGVILGCELTAEGFWQECQVRLT